MPMRLPYPRDFASTNPPDEEPRMKECPKCKGKGWIPGATFGAPIFGVDMDPCPTCHGTGQVPREEPEDAMFDTLEECDGKR